CTLTLNPLAGFTNTVVLSASHLPNGITASFNPTSVTNGSGFATLTLSASDSAVGGIYALTNGMTVPGTRSIGTRTAAIALVLRPRPIMVSAKVVGTNFVIDGTNGFAGATFNVLSSPDATRPLSQWQMVATSVFGANGVFSVTNKISAASRFFVIRY